MKNKDKTHCKHGHELAGDNVYFSPRRPKSRVCRACMSISNAAYHKTRAPRIWIPAIKKSPVERIFEKIDKTLGFGPDGTCWKWMSTTNAKGYAVMSIEGRFKLIHRYFYEFTYGEIGSRKIFVCHRCDNPSCINPDHMFLGTNGDNVRDMVAKGRHFNQKKTHCVHGHEFTPENTKPGLNGGRQCIKCWNNAASITRQWRVDKKTRMAAEAAQ